MHRLHFHHYLFNQRTIEGHVLFHLFYLRLDEILKAGENTAEDRLKSILDVVLYFAVESLLRSLKQPSRAEITLLSQNSSLRTHIQIFFVLDVFLQSDSSGQFHKQADTDLTIEAPAVF